MQKVYPRLCIRYLYKQVQVPFLVYESNGIYANCPRHHFCPHFTHRNLGSSRCLFICRIYFQIENPVVSFSLGHDEIMIVSGPVMARDGRRMAWGSNESRSAMVVVLLVKSETL